MEGQDLRLGVGPSGLTRGAINHMSCRQALFWISYIGFDDAGQKCCAGWRYPRLGPTAEETRARRQYPGKPGGRGSN